MTREMPRKPLRLVPPSGDDPAPAAMPRICKRPACPNKLSTGDKQGRKPSFCSDECRRLYANEQRQVATVYREACRLAEQYELPLTDPDARAAAPINGVLEERTRARSHDAVALDRLVRALLTLEIKAERLPGITAKDLIVDLRRARDHALRISIGVDT